MLSVLPIPLKNLNYSQAKVGGPETSKFPPIPQISGFRSTAVASKDQKAISLKKDLVCQSECKLKYPWLAI